MHHILGKLQFNFFRLSKNKTNEHIQVNCLDYGSLRRRKRCVILTSAMLQEVYMLNITKQTFYVFVATMFLFDLAVCLTYKNRPPSAFIDLIFVILFICGQAQNNISYIFSERFTCEVIFAHCLYETTVFCEDEIVSAAK
jgi:hypothetical protein